MKAAITFYIGVFVAVLSAAQFIITWEVFRLIGLAVGIFFVFWGLKVGWTKKRNITVLIGHIAIVAGCLVSAYAFYQMPFLHKAPSFVEVLDMPLFWGIFTIWGGNCMITHGYCSCAIKMHETNNKLKQISFSNTDGKVKNEISV